MTDQIPKPKVGLKPAIQEESEMGNNSVLTISDVNKSFGGLRALSNINLDIEEGKIHAIIGPNGAGKSTLLNVCIGRLAPDTGSVTFNGKNMVGLQPHEINHAGMVRVFQTPEIFADLRGNPCL